MPFRVITGVIKRRPWQKPKVVRPKPAIISSGFKKKVLIRPDCLFKKPKRRISTDVLHDHALHMTVERDHNEMKLEFSPMNNYMTIQSAKNRVFAKKISIHIVFDETETFTSGCKFERVLYDLPYPLVIGYKSNVS